MKKAAFPKILITLLLLALTAFIVYTHATTHTSQELVAWYEKAGDFVCRYDMVLIGIILAVNLVELIDWIVCAKRDTVINANYEWLQGHMGCTTFFKHYFAPMFCKGPYIFATEEAGSAWIRVIIGLVSGVVKFAYWLLILLVASGEVLSEEYYNAVTQGNPDYWFTFWVLFACINCNVFVYGLYRMLPLYEVREYEVERHYSDGSVTRSRESSGNFLMIAILAVLIYGFYSAYYLLPFGSKLNRCIETWRFKSFVDRSRYNESILDFYRNK